ncbi:pyruvate/2-oxoglutarate dehydrogenase complex dihydrolipoamide dehydrogenase (E3) component [Plasticicumulans lactativorans]|uniref:Pyruvate/2-oxoglutarate dehydrogenase complex dihydrolipoamide dehydrogenase (E3) component n=1 Tax=Plasticicumulans lactativorans TaxID=1133106 RepID=A0A4R2KXU2_9GAMM|nr:FAD-dependent oxidoreductase [Plasticicumulans lactativorans]TCO78844.1 pyruvate/2-oxoglutarate dehydrogenase complex dihydrolipoamide dehydrogenase (E3) component [Plasticicumulans lactativorans]
MTHTVDADLCVIGAGSGGLSVAAGAAQLGARTVLIERALMGGDCLNHGCVPSKSLLAAAAAAQAVRDAPRFGVDAGAPHVDFARVRAHVDGVIAAIAPHDSEERFTALGCRVIRAHARFTAPDTLVAGDLSVRARRFVIATGSRPALPPLPGLAERPYLTNESVFALPACPAHLLVLGGGPVGAELAQAFRRLGAAVTLLARTRLLPKEDPQLAAVVLARLRAEGVDVREGCRVERVGGAAGALVLELRDAAGATSTLTGSHLLVAVGRLPNVEDLGLEAAGITTGAGGIAVDARLRTSNRRVFAIGDVVGSYPFTHVAGYHAGIVIRNALFRLPAKVDYRAVPWATYTDPELARVGLDEAAARARHGAVRVLTWAFADNDRARAEAATAGLVKVVATPRGRLLGAAIVGRHAGELIQPWCLALARGLKVGALAGLTVPYPTLAEVNPRVAGSFYAATLFGPRMRRLVRWLARLG